MGIQQWHEPPTPPVSARDTGQRPREERVTSTANRPDGDTRRDASPQVSVERRLRYGRSRCHHPSIHPLHGCGCSDPGPPFRDRDRNGDEVRVAAPIMENPGAGHIPGKLRRRERGCVMNPESRRGEENSWQSSAFRL